MKKLIYLISMILIYLSIMTTECYACDQDPIVQLGIYHGASIYLNVGESRRFVNLSYDPDDGTTTGAGIVAWWWEISGGEYYDEGGSYLDWEFEDAGIYYVYLWVKDNDNPYTWFGPAVLTVYVSEVAEPFSWFIDDTIDYGEGPIYVQLNESFAIRAAGFPYYTVPFNYYTYFSGNSPTWSVTGPSNPNYALSYSGYCLGGGLDIISFYDGISVPGTYTVSAKAGANDPGESIDIVAFDFKISNCSEEFIPSGGPDSSDDNTTTFTAVLPDGVSAPIRFTLYDVSDEPGYCMNKPSTIPSSGEDSDSWKDLQFPSQTGYTINGSVATTTISVNSATVIVKSYDCGAYGKIKAEAQIDGEWLTAHIDGGTEIFARIPKDVDNGNNEPYISVAWTYHGPSYDDDDTSANNTVEGDGLIRYYEYRGIDFNGDGKISNNERLNPNQKDLFVQGDGFGENFPSFSWGNAFNEAGVDVNEFIGNIGIDDNHIDVLVVTATNVDYENWIDGGHIYQQNAPISGIRQWTMDTLGVSPTGNLQYGSPCNIYKKAINYYFSDKPYIDNNTWTAAGTWGSVPNGVLDPIVPERVEDTNDNGELNNNEKDGNTKAPHDNGDNNFDGDYPVISGSFWDYDQDLNPMDIDKDGLVELPLDNEVPATNEFTKVQVVQHVTTHEIGHAVGITYDENGGHCEDSTCLMFKYSNNWSRDGHFCDNCRAKIKIHNH